MCVYYEGGVALAFPASDYIMRPTNAPHHDSSLPTQQRSF